MGHSQLCFIHFYQAVGTDNLPSHGNEKAHHKPDRYLSAGKAFSQTKAIRVCLDMKDQQQKSEQGEKYVWKGKHRVGQCHGGQARSFCPAASVKQLLHKLEQSCLLIVAFKELPFGSNKQRMFLDMSLWRNILKAD